MAAKTGLSVLLAAAVVGASAPVNAQPAQGLQFVDYTDEFATVWEETSMLPDGRRAPAFRAAFAKILPGFYDHRRISGMTEAQYDERLLKGLKAYPEQRAGIARVAQDFVSSIAPARASFEQSFGPMRGYPPIYLVHSLGEFDGGTRELQDRVHLMFGADMIDRLYKDTPIQPFFHHELFHLHHRRTFQDCEPIWCNLWSEGLAIFVASKLNPGATDASLLLTFPVSLREAVERDRNGALCSIAAKLNSTEPGDYAPIFQGRPQPGSRFPPRYGYYVGYLVAQDVGRTRDLKQLTALTAAEVAPLIKQSLESMASCPEAAAGERG